MSLLLLSTGILFVCGALYASLDSWRRLRGECRVLGTLGGIFVAVGGGAFFSIGLSAIGVMPATFEWPVGRADQIIALPNGLQVATHTPSSRIQVYDKSWHFVRAWHVDAGGGVFEARLTATRLLEVWTARGERRLVFQPDGRLVEAGSYAPASYYDFQEDGAPGFVPTPLPLWIFANPLVAWGVAAVGMLMFASSKRTRKRSQGGGRCSPRPTSRSPR